MKYCRQFSKYLNTRGIPAFVPDFRRPDLTYMPHIFSEQEISNIFSVADNMQVNGTTIIKIQFPVILRVLYGSGLRVGEALSLKFDDVDIPNGILQVNNAKGNKDRLVPIDGTLTNVLKEYINIVFYNTKENHFLFAGRKGKSRHQDWVSRNFAKVLKLAGIDRDVPLTGRSDICVHCLRHTFAVHSFHKQEVSGIDNYREAPSLSIYLGHENLLETQKYLHSSEENSSYIIDKGKECAKSLFPEVPQ